MEGVTGASFEDFVARGILGPARMAHSGFVWQESYAGEMAAGYDRAGMAVEGQRYARPAAATTLYTSIQDYSRFVLYLLASAPALRAHESAVSMMVNPSVGVEEANSISWGLGLGVEKTKDEIFFFQRERSPGFQCFVLASRGTGSGIVIFTNSGNGLDAVPDIVAATLGGNHPVLKSSFLRTE
jgi:CubicO group peptidase (beta-lactamase class C family)